MTNKEDNLEIQTFQIHAADESTATPRIADKELVDNTFGGLKKSSSFHELSEKKVSVKSRSKTKNNGKSKLKRSSQVVAKPDNLNSILQGIAYGVGAGMLVMVIDFIYLITK